MKTFIIDGKLTTSSRPVENGVVTITTYISI